MASVCPGRVVQSVQGLLKFYLAQGVLLVVNLMHLGQGTLGVPPDHPHHDYIIPLFENPSILCAFRLDMTNIFHLSPFRYLTVIIPPQGDPCRLTVLLPPQGAEGLVCCPQFIRTILLTKIYPGVFYLSFFW